MIDKILGLIWGGVVGMVLLMFWVATAKAFDFLPDPKFKLLFMISAWSAGALVGYAYVVIWSKWRVK